jgi:hypothetical protein
MNAWPINPKMRLKLMKKHRPMFARALRIRRNSSITLHQDGPIAQLNLQAQTRWRHSQRPGA